MKNLAAHPGTLLLAQGRSGSSFLGSWFQATPKFLYFVEPCALPYTGKLFYFYLFVLVRDVAQLSLDFC